ncbi:fimbrial biogenesis chaperone [Cronobacter muytjensii]|uniref:fimbrial biogenesis chaperone n=1 Tax=Cronobacter muytjensii TaxID=413501 RepID=UPI001588249C|nr:molecular chaperone [Cronobacter muytjensii]NUW58333.1 molecular chaperone [Cronobacter muytjensii]
MHLATSLRRSGMAAAFWLMTGSAWAAGNMLIWPIDPYLAPDDNAAELWIQNQGATPMTMQVRIVRWRQEGGNERYQQQQDVVASPPIVRIDGNKKQLIRLIRQAAIPAGVEQAYRIVVDEIPQPTEPGKPQLGLKLQMRYSIPLFAYGQGVATQRAGAHHAFLQPENLSWRVVRDNAQPAIEITNRDQIHARISKVTIQQGGQRRTLAEGLLGYVLPGQKRVFPLPASMPQPTQLSASVNAREAKWQAAAR